MSRRPRQRRKGRDHAITLDRHDTRMALHVGPLNVEPPDVSKVLDLERNIVIVPYLSHVGGDTQHALRGLEEMGFRVDWLKGASAIDIIRSLMASQAVDEDLESFLFVDADMAFDPADAVKLFLSDHPVVSGCYAAKTLGKHGRLNVVWHESVDKVVLGPMAPHPYPASRVGAGFLRIKVDFLKRMIEQLELPRCHAQDMQLWPFFLPALVPGPRGLEYLGEDFAFCWRCQQMGVNPMIDTSFRTYHVGDYLFGWEEGLHQYVPRLNNQEVVLRPR